ncbi:Right handed beta helix region/Periplasmic copper-binding protein (NosD), putative [Angomonas deanei]|uniref:Right handed beta helix region/Periplasmic copper-binding protein (NosD), putative n=1 Tax=Angomonas deanei TaxID=59799 RepID=A0A7G2CN12_9TRYP|nr:Right handed beta helix region/Periplasmic copper-binding protein (NosD), putative [Angomonas deanei]
MTEHLAGYGVLANSNASGQFSNCLFDSNQHAARLGLGARTVFRRCRFFRQAGEAILLGDRCKGDIVNCIFKDTRSIHLRVVGPGTTPKIEGNDFSTETPFTAILCEDRCAPQIMGNKLSFIQNSAIVVQEKAQPEIAKNTFDRCKSGVLISSESKGKMGGNSFTTMSEFAFKITGYDTKPVIDENSILGGKAVGILVHGYGAAPTVKYNSLDENVVGLRLQEGAEGEFTHNTFRRHDTAIHVDDCGGYFTGNNIYDSTEAGIKVLGSHAMPYFVRNTVQSGKKTGLWITGGQGRFTCNAISLNGTSGGLLEGAATQFVFVANEFHNNGGCGLAVTGGGTPQLYCNVFTENKRGGVEVSDKQTAPVLEGNYFKHNFRHGILFRSGAAGKMQTSVFTATQEGPAVVVDDEAEPSFEDLVLFNNGSGGLLVKPGGTCTALRCLFVRNVGEAACTVKGNETTITKLTGCVFVENSCSLLAAAATNTELTACAFLGQHSDGPAVTVTKDASPSFTHCLFALAKCGLASTGHARLKRSIFYDCNTGAELQDGGTSLFECEVLAGGTGVNITGGLPSLMGSLFASCTKSGITVSGGAPSISECGVLRCAKGLTLDGSAEGSVENNRIFWNQENILVNDNAATEIRNNLIYDAVSIGVHVRNGAPKLMNNVIFDNLYAGVAVDGATGGKLEGNDIYFPRDDGALVVKDKGDTKKVFSTASNTLRNGISPPGCAQYKTLAERQQQYKAVENEKEKSYANYVDLRKLIDETTAFTLLRVTEMASRSVASSHKVQWLLKDGKDDDADGSPLSPTNGGKEAVDHHLEPFASRWDKLSVRVERGGPAGEGAGESTAATSGRLLPFLPAGEPPSRGVVHQLPPGHHRHRRVGERTAPDQQKYHSV